MGGTEIVAQTPANPGASEGSGRFRPTATMPADVPEKYRLRWERLAEVADRQYRAAVELHCADCCCWYRPEARDCAISTCSLWALNRRIFGGDAEAEGEVPE